MKRAMIVEGVKIVENDNVKIFRSEEFNMNFCKKTGYNEMWGKTQDDDPVSAPFPTILDIEITTICKGPANKVCSFCYKSNLPDRGHNMSFEEFKNIIDKMPFLTQIALGADAHGTSNPDMFKMMEYARSRGIIPNLTIADVSDEVADKLVAVAGAVAVSVYDHAGFDVAFDSIKKLTDRGMTQVNIHRMVSHETLDNTYRLLDAIQGDSRLEKLNACVFLGLKQKGRGKRFKTVEQADYTKLVDTCLERGIPFGFDSCSAAAFLNAVKDRPDYSKYETMAEPCESTVFSSYINERGYFYPCSFTEDWVEGNWTSGINVLKAVDFIKDVWNHPKTETFRNALISNVDENKCRNCPAFVVCGKDMRVHQSDRIEFVEVV